MAGILTPDPRHWHIDDMEPLTGTGGSNLSFKRTQVERTRYDWC